MPKTNPFPKLVCLLTLAAALAFTGCGTPESLRQTNRLDADAARQLQTDAGDVEKVATILETVQPQAAAGLHSLAAAMLAAAKNIENGSLAIERYNGPPDNPVPYTIQAHTDTVVKANADLDNREKIQQAVEGFFTKTLGALADKAVPGAGIIITGVAVWALNAYRKMKTAFKTVAAKVEDHPGLKGAIALYAGQIGEGKTVKWAVDKVGVTGGPPATVAAGPTAPPTPVPPASPPAQPSPEVAIFDTAPEKAKSVPA